MNTPSQLIVTKSNRLVEGSQALTLNEMRILAMAAAQLDPKREDPLKATLTIDVAAFAKTFGIDPRNAYETVRVASESLYERSMVIMEDTRRGPRRRARRFLDAADYLPGEGKVSLGFTRHIAPHLSELRSGYITFPLLDVAGLKTFHSMRLFEIAILHVTKGESTFEIDLVTLRDRLGVADHEYKVWADFQKWVLRPAVEAINLETQHQLEANPVRQERRIASVLFTMTQKAIAEIAAE